MAFTMSCCDRVRACYDIKEVAWTTWSLVDDGFEFVSKWHNDLNPNDVNDDGSVTASDAIMVINEMGRRAGSDLPVDRVLRQINAVIRFLDTNGDDRITAVDALAGHQPDGTRLGKTTVRERRTSRVPSLFHLTAKPLTSSIARTSGKILDCLF